MSQLNERVAIITGAGRGIGRAIARSYATEGAKVVIAEVNNESGENAAQEIREQGGKALYVPVDMSNLSSINSMITRSTAQFGQIDILVNNAGVTSHLGFFDVTEKDWDRMHNINAKGLFFCMQSVAKVMREQGHGRIVNIASIAGKGFRATSNISYAGSKGAVIAMTRLAAVALGKFNINVNAVCPGVTRTELFEEIMNERLEKTGLTEEQAFTLDDILIKRLNESDDIAQLAVFLASDKARNVTGQSWNVDGGLVFD